MPQFHFGEMATALEKQADGRWKLKTDAGTEIIAPVVVIAAGAGSVRAQAPAGAGHRAFRECRRRRWRALRGAQDGNLPRQEYPDRRRRRQRAGLGDQPGAFGQVA